MTFLRAPPLLMILPKILTQGFYPSLFFSSISFSRGAEVIIKFLGHPVIVSKGRFKPMQNLSNGENTVLGCVTAAVVAVSLQPTLYYKNKIQQQLPWKLVTHPRELYRKHNSSAIDQFSCLFPAFDVCASCLGVVLFCSGCSVIFLCCGLSQEAYFLSERVSFGIQFKSCV
jgi:hypothetical protein